MKQLLVFIDTLSAQLYMVISAKQKRKADHMTEGVRLTDIEARKVKILGIAPYSGMKSLMEQVVSGRDDIELDVYVGDLDQGVNIALQNIQSNYDILISRGGTAQMLQAESSLPVVEVAISIYDILRAVKLCENFNQPYTMVGFPNITANAHVLCELMHYSIDIYTIHNHQEASETLQELKSRGITMVLCDMVTYTEAQKMGFNAILITSGLESVSSAFEQAVSLYNTSRKIIAQNRFYQDILQKSSEKILVMKENGEIVFTTIDTQLLSRVIPLLAPELPAVIRKTETKFFKNIDQMLYSCICRTCMYLGSRYAVFYLAVNSIPIISGKYGIQYSSQKDVSDVFFNSLYNVSEIDFDKLDQVSFPVLLIGEQGTGKEHAARMIYSRSRLNRHPLITISCDLLNERSWNFLFNHYNSPFNDNENTLFLKNINSLSPERFQQMLSTIIDTNLSHRNRLILSCACLPGQTSSPEILKLTSLLSCITYYMHPIRERKEDIPVLCTLYLNSVNLSIANQITGLEPDALVLLQAYSWPYNYTQFRRVLNELTLVTKTPYIQAQHVRQIFEKEQELARSVNTAPPAESRSEIHSLDLSRSLNEIILDVIKLVLEEHSGNQSAAAKQLKIGRSTLWRYLK